MEMILFCGSFLIVLLSSIILRIVYFIFKHKSVSSNITGKEAANLILKNHDIDNIEVNPISGDLSDYYSNSSQEIRLSEGIYDGKSIASVAVAAHECGHAIQYHEGYTPIRIRNVLAPITSFGSSAGYYILMISLVSSKTKLFALGIILIMLGLVFQILTLPVEINASRRGKKALKELNIIEDSEGLGVTIMLAAAAFTYLAGLLSSMFEILRLILIFQNRRDD